MDNINLCETIDIDDTYNSDAVKRGADETPLQYIWRLCSAKDSGVLNITWQEVADILNSELIDDESEYLGESAYRKKYQQAKAFYDDVFSKMYSTEYSDQIAAERRQLIKERYKLQTEKLEYSRWLREDARDELFEEKTIEAIKRYSGRISPPKEISITRGTREGVLCFADCHFGKEFAIYGLHNEVLNEYSPEVFYDRMAQIYSETLDAIRREGFTHIRVYNLGDSVDGFLRNSQLWSLRWGVIDSAVIFGNYLGDWLRMLSEHVAVTYAQTDGNHDELRLLDGKKGQHLCESAGKIIKNCILLKNEHNPNFTYIENKTGLINDTICGYNILGIHGEEKDLSQALLEYSNLYGSNIAYLISGHKHQESYANCGIRKGCIGVGSIVGNDDYATKLRYAASPTATILIFEDGKGKVDEHTIVLH